MTWEEFWQNVSVFQAVGWILGALAVIAFLVKGWPKIRRFVKTVDALLTLQDDITYIRGQLTNNGGSTVKDAAQQTATLAQETSDRVAELTTQVKATNRKADKAAREAVAAKTIAAQSQALIIEHLVSADTDRAHLRADLQAPLTRLTPPKENQ